MTSWQIVILEVSHGKLISGYGPLTINYDSEEILERGLGRGIPGFEIPVEHSVPDKVRLRVPRSS
jgi:hypothetical protein